jgi:hypothetical protein
MGTFLGVSASLNSSALSGGFGADQTQSGFVAGVEANIRFGFGMEGVLNEAGDGLVFLQFGWRSDGAATMQSGIPNLQNPTTNSYTAAIPGRSAYNLRLRLPFWLIPGDLIILGPILYLISPKAATSVAVTAGNGGLIPWQTGIATSVGRFQFVLGREIGVSLYGLNKTKDAIAIPTKTAFTAIEYKSTLLDFPFLEWMPFNRSFSQWQSSSVLLQFSAGVNIPYGVSVIQPTQAPVPALKSVWQLGLRVIFDWRHYL